MQELRFVAINDKLISIGFH